MWHSSIQQIVLATIHEIPNKKRPKSLKEGLASTSQASRKFSGKRRRREYQDKNKGSFDPEGDIDPAYYEKLLHYYEAKRDSYQTERNIRPQTIRAKSSVKLSYTITVMIAGFFVVILAISNPSIGVLFGFGILLWVIGVLGTIYAVSHRVVGRRAAKWVFGILLLTLIIDLVFNQGKD